MAPLLLYKSHMKQICRLILAMVLVLGTSLTLRAADDTKASNRAKTEKLLQKNSSGSSFRIGGNSGGGGDEEGLDFQNTALRALAGLRNTLPDLYHSLESADLVSVIAAMNVIVVDEGLAVEAQIFVQNSVAANLPDYATVVLNRKRWRAIRDQGLREGIALHEVLSLKRLESTGDYSISSRYVKALGVSPERLKIELSANPEDQVLVFSPQAELFENLKHSYEESQEKLSLDDLVEFSNSRKYICTYVVKDMDTNEVEPSRAGLLSVQTKNSKPGAIVDFNKVLDFKVVDSMRVSNGQFLSHTEETGPFEIHRRSTTIRKNKDGLTAYWTKRTLRPGYGSSEKSAYGFCYSNQDTL